MGFKRGAIVDAILFSAWQSEMKRWIEARAPPPEPSTDGPGWNSFRER